jgi:uncharacterized pyridoxamine 5'-phosphate oxidase family protein
MKSYKTLSLVALITVSCSSVEVRPVGQLIDTSKKQLSENSKKYFKQSGMDDTVPVELDKDHFYSKLALNENYRNYLQSECILLLHKDQELNLERPVYAALPQWNNIENYFYMLFNFQSMNKDALTEQTMECDVAVSRNKEVTDYQLKKSYLQFHKAP